MGTSGSSIRRREFLKTAGVLCGSALLPASASATPSPSSDVEFDAVLVDILKCTGCRKCEEACADANHLPRPDINDKSVFEQRRTTGTDSWTVVNRFPSRNGYLYVKSQCMHCNQPACASACLVSAMKKTPEGPVIWRGSKCMGCRFCMVSCPFDVPKFEYDSPVPKIQKCIFCRERLQKGQLPACVEGCPVEALVFGKRRDLIELARARIYQNPGSYVPQIYGEHEVGGTSWLYISPVPFEELGFRTQLGNTPFPEYSKDFLYAVPVILTLWPAFLLGVNRARSAASHEEESSEAEGAPR